MYDYPCNFQELREYYNREFIKKSPELELPEFDQLSAEQIRSLNNSMGFTGYKTEKVRVQFLNSIGKTYGFNKLIKWLNKKLS